MYSAFNYSYYHILLSQSVYTCRRIIEQLPRSYSGAFDCFHSNENLPFSAYCYSMFLLADCCARDTVVCISQELDNYRERGTPAPGVRIEISSTTSDAPPRCRANEKISRALISRPAYGAFSILAFEYYKH